MHPGEAGGDMDTMNDEGGKFGGGGGIPVYSGNNPEMGGSRKPCNYGPGCNKKATCKFDHGEGQLTGGG